MSAAERIRAALETLGDPRGGPGMWSMQRLAALDALTDLERDLIVLQVAETERVRLETALREIATSKPWGQSAVENTARAYRVVDIAREALAAGSASTETSERSGT